jgi:hypothetical protein
MGRLLTMAATFAGTDFLQLVVETMASAKQTTAAEDLFMWATTL